MLLNTLLLRLAYIVSTVTLCALILISVCLLKVGEAVSVVFHQSLKDFAHTLDLSTHALAHPDSTFHIFLLVFSLATLTKLLKSLQVLFELAVFGLDFFALLLELCYHEKIILDHFHTSGRILQRHHLLLSPLQLLKFLCELCNLALHGLLVLSSTIFIEVRSVAEFPLQLVYFFLALLLDAYDLLSLSIPVDTIQVT